MRTTATRTLSPQSARRGAPGCAASTLSAVARSVFRGRLAGSRTSQSALESVFVAVGPAVTAGRGTEGRFDSTADGDGRGWPLVRGRRVRGRQRLATAAGAASSGGAGQHCYVSGILLDPASSDDSLGAIWRFLDDQGLHGVSFPQFPVESRLGDQLASHCTSAICRRSSTVFIVVLR